MAVEECVQIGRPGAFVGLSPDGFVQRCDIEGPDFFGYQDRDLVGRPISQLFADDANVESWPADGPSRRRLIRAKDRTLHYVAVRWIHGNASPVMHLEDVTHVVCEEQRAALDRVYGVPFQHVSDAILVVNQAQRIVLANPVAEEKMRLTKSLLEGQPTLKWLSKLPHAAPGDEPIVKKATLTVQTAPLACTVIVRPLEYEDDHYQMVVLGDCSDDLHEAVWQAEQNFRLLVEAVEEYAIIALDPVGRVASWNAGAERVTGYTRSEVMGRYVGCFYPDEDQASGKPARALVAAGREGRFIEEGERVRKDGTHCWVSVVVTAIRDHEGKIQGFLNVTRDITERRRAEQIERERDGARERAKAHRRFLHIAAHELRNPMQGIYGILELVKRRAENGRGLVGQEHMLAMMDLEVQRLSTLLDEVLEAYRIDTPGFRVNRTSINLQTVVTTALAPAREAYPDYTFDVQMGSAGAWLSGDRLRLEAVIRNLLDNAVKYSPAGSTIRIRLEHQLEGLHLIVSDEGLGIPAAELERVFEGFFRGSNLRSHDPGGMGLGLQLCRQIVACHDGRIWAESEEGRGTKIHIILPREEVELDGAGAAS